MARFATLAGWLDWQSSLHPTAMDFGLDRVRPVYRGMFPPGVPYRVLTVAGTNGKGSSVALLEAVLRAAGLRVGCYTSPHLVRYNERVRIDGREVDDDALCEAFEAVDLARGDTSLTYFEFGTLAALWLFREAGLPLAVLEVGLGGRLDAVNLVDADAALVTTVDLDHLEWLGPDRNHVGREKAGVFRAGRPGVCNDPMPPAGLLEAAQECGVRLHRVGRDYQFAVAGDGWDWWRRGRVLRGLPLPALPGGHQIHNAAGVLALLDTVGDWLTVPEAAIVEGLRRQRLAGRFQVRPGPVEWIFDVTHNAHGAATLAEALRGRPCTGRTLAVVAMLADKDAAAVARAMAGPVDAWIAAGLSGPRARGSADLARALAAGSLATHIMTAPDVASACALARRIAVAGDRVLVFGSFHTVAEALTAADAPAEVEVVG